MDSEPARLVSDSWERLIASFRVESGSREPAPTSRDSAHESAREYSRVLTEFIDREKGDRRNGSLRVTYHAERDVSDQSVSCMYIQYRETSYSANVASEGVVQ